MTFFTSPLKVYRHVYTCICLGLVVFFVIALSALNTSARTLTYTCTLPYNADISPKTAQIIAKSFAYTQALTLVEEEFNKNKAISLGLRDTNLHKAVAAELYTANVHSEPQEFTAPVGDVHITVKISLPDNNTDQDVGELLSAYDLLEMRLELVELLEKYAHEGQKIILVLSGIQKNTQDIPHYTLHRELINTAQSLQALWLYAEALKHFEKTWNDPTLVQKNLEQATKLAPGIAALWLALGEVQLQLDQPRNALQSLDKALNLQPDRARIFYVRGLGHLRLQQPSLAKADLDTALKYKPKEATWLNARGAISLILEDYASMCNDFEQACGLGQCDGLAHARQRNLCLQ